MEDKDKKGLFGKISDKWSQAREILKNKTEKVKEKLHDAKETIKEKFKQTKTKIVVSIVGLALAGAVTLVACGLKHNQPDIDFNDGGNDITYETTIDGETIEVLNPNNGNTQNENISTNSLESYVLNNPEYSNIITQTASMKDMDHEKIYILDPHPYSYLEQKGYDVQGIKNGTVECETVSYTLDEDDNSVFIATKVYENGIANHIHLEYELNKKDFEFYNLVSNNSYIQNAFINDAVSKLNKPVNETCIKMSTSDSKGIDESFQIYANGNYATTVLTNVNTSDKTFDCLVIPKFFNSNIMNGNHSSVGIVKTTSRTSIKNNNGVYDIASARSAMTEAGYEEKQGIFHQFQDVNPLSHTIRDLNYQN